MKPMDCEFESEVLSAVLQSRWPDRADAALRAHVPTCPICRDVAAIAGAIDESRDEMRAAAVVPDSGRVWWVAQMRARREAAQAAGRPITAAQVLAFACAAAVLGACFGATSSWFQSALRYVAANLAGFKWRTAATLIAQHGLLALAAAAMLVLIPAAVYLAMLRD